MGACNVWCYVYVIKYDWPNPEFQSSYRRVFSNGYWGNSFKVFRHSQQLWIVPPAAFSLPFEWDLGLRTQLWRSLVHADGLSVGFPGGTPPALIIHHPRKGSSITGSYRPSPTLPTIAAFFYGVLAGVTEATDIYHENEKAPTHTHIHTQSEENVYRAQCTRACCVRACVQHGPVLRQW